MSRWQVAIAHVTLLTAVSQMAPKPAVISSLTAYLRDTLTNKEILRSMNEAIQKNAPVTKRGARVWKDRNSRIDLGSRDHDIPTLYHLDLQVNAKPDHQAMKNIVKLQGTHGKLVQFTYDVAKPMTDEELAETLLPGVLRRKKSDIGRASDKEDKNEEQGSSSKAATKAKGKGKQGK
ncbi:hypothetical protein GGG16DRAFT_101866 [Schizophyllum commune]